MKSARRASSSDPSATGTSGIPEGVTDPRSLAHRVPRAGDLTAGAAIFPHRTHRLLLCLSADPPETDHEPSRPGGSRDVSRMFTVAFPVHTTGPVPLHRPSESPPSPGTSRRASDVINGTNLIRKDKPRWPNGNVTETMAFMFAARPGLTAPRGRRHSVRLPGLPHLARSRRIPDWLSGLVRPAGATLFARSDTEARWRRWNITELRGGLARSYRDPRFDALRSLYDVAEQMSARVGSACQAERDGPPR